MDKEFIENCVAPFIKEHKIVYVAPSHSILINGVKMVNESETPEFMNKIFGWDLEMAKEIYRVSVDLKGIKRYLGLSWSGLGKLIDLINGRKIGEVER